MLILLILVGILLIYLTILKVFVLLDAHYSTKTSKLSNK